VCEGVLGYHSLGDFEGIGACVRALRYITRWAISRERRVCEGVWGYHSLGDFEGIGACLRAFGDVARWAISKASACLRAFGTLRVICSSLFDFELSETASFS
jgi:hypothetical protein